MATNIQVSTVKINEKSFDNFSGPSLPFRQYNILFGQNGHGKSTLASNIFHAASGGGLKNNELRIYNARYIQDTLLLKEHEGKITSVRANFGKENTGIEEQVLALEDDIKQLQNSLNDTAGVKGLLSQRKTALKDMETEVKSVHDTYKGSTSVKLKFSQSNPFELTHLSAYNTDYIDGTKKFKEEDIAIANGSDDHEANLARINGIVVSEINAQDKIEELEIDSSIDILNKTYTSDTPSSKDLDWVREGVDLHEHSDKCKFCQNDIKIEDIVKRLKKYESDTKVSDMLAIKGFETKLKSYTKVATALQTSFTTYKEFYSSEEEYQKDVELLDTASGALQDALVATATKLSNNNKSVIQDSEVLVEAIDNIDVITKNIHKLKDASLSSVTNKINLQNTLVKARIGLEVNQSTLIAKKQIEYAQLDKKVNSTNADITSKQTQISELKSLKSEIANFANYVNSVLASLGCDFKLVADKEDASYELKHLKNTDISIEDISEGEKNLLALLYFYFEMLQDDEKTLKTDIKLIVIDDPLASLDDENRFYILEVMKSLLQSNSAQVFVFTHQWLSFTDLAYGRTSKSKTDTAVYEIIKTNSISGVYESKAQQQPYKKLYEQIFQFSQENPADVDTDTYLHMPNSIRRVLEDYLRFYAGIILVTSSSVEQVSRALLKTDYTALTSKQKFQLNTLLSVANILSHRIPTGPSNTEIHSSAKFFMNKMSENHAEHHHAMKV